jgi:hypothetical protein
MLGVSEAALRQWTDEGKIKVFITPGGHRRYSRGDLNKFMSSPPKMLGVKDLAAELEETVELHREIARKHIASAPWYDKFGRESQEHFANLGRQLLNFIIRYVTEPTKRKETVQHARGVGHDMGRMLENLGLPLTDSVEAFLMHREPVMSAVAHLMKKKEAFSGRIVEAIPLVAHIMDEALVALVAAHQQYRNGSQSNPKGGDTT